MVVYNKPMRVRRMSRRRFLKSLAWLAVAGFAPPTPPVPSPTTTEPREYFVPLGAYHELPADCYAQNLIEPLEIIVHWDGNRQGRDLWLAPVTFETLAYVKQSSHFAVDYKQAWQMLPMYGSVVQESFGSMGYNWEAINVEMAGTEFDAPGGLPPDSEIVLTVALVSRLMDHYRIAFDHVAGHFERDPRGDKRDPGVRFMASFRERLAEYRASLSPVTRRHLAER
jgi:hypothetical protein